MRLLSSMVLALIELVKYTVVDSESCADAVLFCLLLLA